jgi:hypothetical protein
MAYNTYILSAARAPEPFLPTPRAICLQYASSFTKRRLQSAELFDKYGEANKDVVVESDI